MKKIIAILSFILISAFAVAQDQIISNYGLAGVTNATASIKTAAYNYTFMLNIPSAYVYTYQVRLQQLTPSDNTATVVLKGSLDNTNFVTITSNTWKGTTIDSTITNTITSSPLNYKYLRITVTPTDTARVKSIWLNAVPLH